MSRRIQRQRTKGWRMPPNAVYVGRPSPWGNPYHVPGKEAGRHDGLTYTLQDDVAVITRQDSVTAFRRYVDRMSRRRNIATWIAPLVGHDLACWCPLDQPCHADVLLELASLPVKTGAT